MEKFVILADLQTALTAVLKKLREWIEKQGFMKNPEKEGKEGQILTTDGKGGRYWKNEEKGTSVSSWNDLTDRPFYETPDGSDTLTWDGNTEGLEYVSSDGAFFYRLSDATPSLEECAGAVFSFSVEELKNIPAGFADAGGALVSMPYQGIIVALSDNTVIEGFATLPKRGVYFTRQEELFVESLTIPGYTGFPSVKQLDPKYLPMQSIVDAVLASVPAAEGGSF